MTAGGIASRLTAENCDKLANRSTLSSQGDVKEDVDQGQR